MCVSIILWSYIDISLLIVLLRRRKNRYIVSIDTAVTVA